MSARSGNAKHQETIAPYQGKTNKHSNRNQGGQGSKEGGGP